MANITSVEREHGIRIECGECGAQIDAPAGTHCPTCGSTSRDVTVMAPPARVEVRAIPPRIVIGGLALITPTEYKVWLFPEEGLHHHEGGTKLVAVKPSGSTHAEAVIPDLSAPGVELGVLLIALVVAGKMYLVRRPSWSDS